MAFNSFEDMPVWKKAMEFAQKIYAITETLPRKEDYGLTSQIRRSAVSVPGNIAEGFGRKHTKDKVNFYYASRGSLTESKSHLIYGKRVGYFKELDSKELKALSDDVMKELNAVISTLHRRIQAKP
jgi:four helix bundle protein